jgi:histidinol-phosphate/aromatic aminotransferase/cobyric acid decarboxylase-like protein
VLWGKCPVIVACGLAAFLALHLRNHLIVKKRIIVAASRFLMLAMLARKHRVKVASVLACDCLDLHCLDPLWLK